MTQEEKFEEAKRLYETANADQRYVLESLFPELKESEDERIIGIIRSTLESYNRGIIFDSLNTKDYADCLAWLEKQGEKEYDWSEESYDDARLNDIVSKVENGLQLNKAEINWLKSIKEKLHKEIYYWTEEEIEPIISDYLRGTEHYGGMIGRLRCLKPKSLEKQAQKPAEWSEEDEHRIKDTVYFLETAKKHYASTVELDACIDWLKSLRPQSQWKPSDEQMGCLSDAIKHYNSLGYPASKLKELLEDLKKLMK